MRSDVCFYAGCIQASKASLLPTTIINVVSISVLLAIHGLMNDIDYSSSKELSEMKPSALGILLTQIWMN